MLFFFFLLFFSLLFLFLFFFISSGKARVRQLHMSALPSEARRRQYVKDAFNFLINAPWKFLLVVFFAMYAASYLFFAIWWYIIAKSDSECLSEVTSFNTAFQFSLETQATIGYGVKNVRGGCEGGTVLLFIQNVVGMLMDACLLGLIFGKLSRPQQRRYTLQFSEFGCLGYRDSKLCLMFRLGDLRINAPFADSHVRLILLYDHTTAEGEVIPFQQQRLVLGDADGITDDSVVIVPREVVHEINNESPLYNKMSYETLVTMNAEFVLIFEGIIQTTGLTLHARTSYKAHEIRFGARYDNNK